MRKFHIFILLFLICGFVLSAHSGRTDRNGGHNGPGGYHYHNSGRSYSNSNTNTDNVTTAEKFYILEDKSEKIYHKKECQTIKGKEVLWLYKYTADNWGYKPCTICNP